MGPTLNMGRTVRVIGVLTVDLISFDPRLLREVIFVKERFSFLLYPPSV